MNARDLFDKHYDELSEQAKEVIEQTEDRVIEELGEFESAQEFNEFVEETY